MRNKKSLQFSEGFVPKAGPDSHWVEPARLPPGIKTMPSGEPATLVSFDREHDEVRKNKNDQRKTTFSHPFPFLTSVPGRLL